MLINPGEEVLLIGRHIEEIIPGIRETGRMEIYENVLKSGKPEKLRYFKATDELQNQDSGAYALKIGNGVAIIIVDVTEWVKEERVIISQLELKNKELEQFAYVASHDLQEPLETISSYLGLFTKKYESNLDEKGTKYISFIVNAAKRMQILVRNILEYSRVGKKVDVGEIDCNEVLKEVLIDLDENVRASEAKINAGELPVLPFNASDIKQLFQNLVSNAIKYRKKDVVPVINIFSERIDGEWEFAVKDNGIGIDEKHFERIFVIFQRLHNRSEYEGTGIGLSLCKKIVESHGGKIRVESKPGEGSTFYFTLKAYQHDEEKIEMRIAH